MSKMHSTVLAACLLSVATLVTAAPSFKPPDNLLGAPAMVISADPASHRVILKVPSTGHQPLVFTVSRSCLFGGGLRSEANLVPNERVSIWTQAGRAGTLPAIIRIDRDQN